jgi:hypothetical protein
MTGAVTERLIREAETEDPQHYSRRVGQLALAYLLVFAGSLAGIALIVWRGELFVTLAQRSNVETLTLAFFVVFFGYLVAITARGAWGALRIAWYALQRLLGAAPLDVERRKAAALGPPGPIVPAVALNVMVELDGTPCRPFDVPVADDAGPMGRLVFDGAELRHKEVRGDGSNSLLAYAVQQIGQLLERRGVDVDLNIVTWRQLADEEHDRYVGLAHFANRLEAHLGADALWPKVRLTAEDLRELERRMTAVCPALRAEAFLPHWEYEAEHQVPLIPEPLGLISLHRSERRVDPVASMGCATAVVLLTLAVLAVFILFPPWVPGK